MGRHVGMFVLGFTPGNRTDIDDAFPEAFIAGTTDLAQRKALTALIMIDLRAPERWRSRVGPGGTKH